MRRISLNEIKRRTGISYPALLRYRDEMLFRCPDKEGWCGPLAPFADVSFTKVGKVVKLSPAAIPLFLRARRVGLANRGRPPLDK